MKRADRRTKLVVGAFILGCLALLAGGILLMGNRITILKGSTKYHAVFKNTAGLHEGASVKMGGVDVGIVDGIAVSARNGEPEAVVTISIFRPNDAVVKQDSQVSLETQGVLGDKFVMLYPGSAASPRLEAGGNLPVRPKPDFDAIIAKSSGIVDAISKTTTKLGEFSEALPSEQAMQGAADDIRASLREVHTFIASLNRDNTLAATLRDREAAVHLRSTLARLDRASSHLESVLAKVDQGKGTLGALVNDTALYDDMRSLMGRANRSKVARFMIRQSLEDETEKSTPAHH